MTKYSLPEISVIISLKIDSQDRRFNVQFLLKYFRKFFKDLEIIVIEQKEPSAPRIVLIPQTQNSVIYHSIEDIGPHYKTRNLNIGTGLATREIIMMIDCDVFLQPKVLVKAVRLMKHSSQTILSPHNGVMVEISKKLYKNVSLDYLIDGLKKFPRNFERKAVQQNTHMYPLYGGKNAFSTGGCILYKKNEIILIGGWNTNMVSYGFEDMEFLFRAKKLGLNHSTFKATNIYHLQHSRSTDSVYNNFYRINESEWNLVASLKVEELQIYSLNCFRRLKLAHGLEYTIVNSDTKFSFSKLTTKKIDLNGATLITLLIVLEKNETYHVNNFVAYLEKFFINYEVNLVEFGEATCKVLSNKKAVKYHHSFSKDFSDYKKIIRSIIRCSSSDPIMLWDFRSFIEPEKIRSGYEQFLRKKTDFVVFDDELWAPPNVWRAEEVGKGLTISLRQRALRHVTLLKSSGA